MKKLLSLFLVLALAFSLCVGVLADETTAAEPSDETAGELAGQIVILHTNDVHGAIDGYAKVAALKADYEAKGAEVLLVDAGDFIQGTTSVSVSQGATAVELMNLAGYDLVTLGNHEFDYGMDNLKTIFAKAEFGVVAANIKLNGAAAFDANKVVELADGTKLGVFGRLRRGPGQGPHRRGLRLHHLPGPPGHRQRERAQPLHRPARQGQRHRRLHRRPQPQHP